MINHENLDKFLSLTPRLKAIILLTAILFFLIGVWVVFLWGKSHGTVSVNPQLKQELNDSIIREQGIRAEAEKLAGINDLLKAQNAEQAKLLIDAQAKLNKNTAEKLKQIFDERQRKLAEIESEPDAKNSIRMLCDEAEQQGYRLSDVLCSEAN